MLLEFFRFELKSWLKNPMIYIFFLINFLLVFVSITNDNISIGGELGNIHLNAPYAIMYNAAFLSLLSIIMTTTFINRAALKDFNHNFDAILFATPIRKTGYFFGRFLSSVLISCIPLLGVFVAILAVPYFVEVEKVGPVYWSAYWHSFLIFILPNTLLIGAIIFALASIFRNTTGSFVGAIVILIGYLMAGDFISSLDNEKMGVLIDPLGINSLSILTKYWTMEDKNTQWLLVTGPILMNRLIWIGIAFIILMLSYLRFSFSKKKAKKKKALKHDPTVLNTRFQNVTLLPDVSINDDKKARLIQIWTQVKSEFLGATKNRAFMLILFFAIINMLNGISYADQIKGSGNHPLTYIVLERISDSLYFFIFVLITYYSGIMVWRERNAKMNEFFDSAPFPSWLPMLAKFIGLVGIIGVILSVAMALGISVQALKGYYNFEVSLYLKQLFLIDYSQFILWIAIAFFIQVLCNHMYLGYFVFILFGIANVYLWDGLEISSNLLVIGGTPKAVYSDFSKFLPYGKGLIGYQVYWLLVVALLVLTSVLFWVRGKGLTLKNRWFIARQRFDRKMALTSIAFFGCWMLTGSFLFYNAEIINTNISSATSEKQTVLYEKLYKKYDGIPQPKIIALDYDIEMYPEKRTVKTMTQVLVKNKHDHPIDSIHFSLPESFKVSFEIEQATLVHQDEDQKYSIYQFKNPMQAGDSLTFVIYSDFEPEGIENEVTMPRITQNGIFLDKLHFMPNVGYDISEELTDADDRKKYGLSTRDRMNALSHSCSAACHNNVLTSDADWIKMNCTISTSADQTAVAPGTLTKEWNENNRKYFRYELDKPVLNFYSFLSAKYEVARTKWDDVDLEVYYNKGHEYNVDKMMSAMRSSLSYYSKEFSPYPFQQARIIEYARFSKTSSFAQAFPGTMPYAESAGFIADLKDENDIDRVFFLVAHEMAHQWWGHQVVGADVQGAMMLAETFAQYSAVMVLEKAYGKQKAKEFLAYEMDGYLRRRGNEKTKELPLMKVENQAYIQYQKGSVAMYALREYIGEQQLNLAMKNFVERTAFQEPPYTTTHVFMEELEKVTPDSLIYLVDDFFRKIVLYNNKISNTKYRQLANGEYKVTLEVNVEKYEADAKGVESKMPLSDYIFIGIYGEQLKDHIPAPVLYYEKVKFDKEQNSFTIIVKEKPYSAGVDPNHLLIDRIPDDNVLSVEEE